MVGRMVRRWWVGCRADGGQMVGRWRAGVGAHRIKKVPECSSESCVTFAGIVYAWCADGVCGVLPKANAPHLEY